jgi:hypothetical protein
MKSLEVHLSVYHTSEPNLTLWQRILDKNSDISWELTGFRPPK